MLLKVWRSRCSKMHGSENTPISLSHSISVSLAAMQTPWLKINGGSAKKHAEETPRPELEQISKEIDPHALVTLGLGEL